MEKIGVISPVEEPTKWCTQLVVVPKPSGDVRICVDFTELNRFVLREWHPIPSVEHTWASLWGESVFKAGRQLRILANSARGREQGVYDVHNAIWKVQV